MQGMSLDSSGGSHSKSKQTKPNYTPKHAREEHRRTEEEI
jgi:hypothetical protein